MIDPMADGPWIMDRGSWTNKQRRLKVQSVGYGLQIGLVLLPARRSGHGY
jgi:hypothetical protein